jgi:hypothetical protein
LVLLCKYHCMHWKGWDSEQLTLIKYLDSNVGPGAMAKLASGCLPNYFCHLIHWFDAWSRYMSRIQYHDHAIFYQKHEFLYQWSWTSETNV